MNPAVIEALRISSIAYPAIFVVNAVFWVLIIVLQKTAPQAEE